MYYNCDREKISLKFIEISLILYGMSDFFGTKCLLRV